MEPSAPPAAWPESVERVSTVLRESGAEARVEEFATGTPTAEDAARAVGCELRQIVKSLLFDCDGRSVLVLVPGDRRADPAKVARVTATARAKVAGAAQVEEATGYPPGGVAPFDLRKVERVLIDKRLLAEPLLWVGAGSERHMAGLPATELLRVSRGEAADVAGD
ncbi:MAG TPA: YbaK/EbsC family protein [Gaiellaceae bacterium]|nr:YbaK/EbsC family protein [Gaiellaceae bacterium]